MAISKPSPHNSFSMQKQGKTTSAFKKKLLHKRPTSSQYKTIKKVENEDLEKPIICYEKRSPKKEERSAVDGAYEVQKSLPSSFPSFVKLMLRSHVSSCFWLGLPKRFCDNHMPQSNTAMILEDERGREYETRYLFAKTGLSGGWRGFSINQSLLEGDAIVFQLIKPCRFKVYISRVNGSAEIDGGAGLLNLDVQPEPLAVKDEDENEKSASENTSDDSPDVCDEFDELSPEVLELEGITFSESVVEFKDVKTLEDFRIIVDGLVIDSEIPTHVRAKYYHLCMAQKDYLHSHLFKGLCCKLAAGVIIEAVKVSDAIRAAKITTHSEELTKWDKRLKFCEDLGMEFGFLSVRLNKLIALHSEHTRMIQMKMNERRKLEMKLVNVKDAINGLDAEIRNLQVENAGSGIAFMEMAEAPW